MKLQLGQIVATPGALEAMEDAEQAPSDFLDRHIKGDWGDCDEDDKNANEQSLIDGTRVLSIYHTKKGVKLWVITEADRSSTCILLPDEY